MKSFISNFSDLSLDVHGVRLPDFSIEDKYRKKFKVSKDKDNHFFLRCLSYAGFEEKIKEGKIDPKDAEKYTKRAKHELEIIFDLGFVDYMLLVWDVINFCKESDIPIGLGRGSAAGSLILFLIGVTGIDPIRHELFFERFISKIRAKKKVVDGITYLDGSLMCDVDLDICYYKRSAVLEFLESKFKGRTAKILTLNTLSGKLLMKECGKVVYDKNETEMNMVSSMIPKVFGKVSDIEDAYEEVDEFKEWCDTNPKAYKIALKLRDLIKNKGVHPSGVLLSYGLLEDSCPTELSSDKNPVSSFDMNWASLSNVKLDILGLRSVSVVDEACKQIGIELANIDIESPEIYRHLQNLKSPHGLFQIEADTNFKVCQKVKPKDLQELSAVLALARPGALAYVDQYANYTNTGTYDVIHPFFEDILSSTGGVCLYQEQMMKMANKVGFTLDEAEILRRIVGKKKIKEVRQWKKKIREKVKENRLSSEWMGYKGADDVGDVLWSVLEDSANYSFNKSHSIAYAALSAATIFLKFNHPKEFFLSLLKMTRYEPDPINEISRIEKELSNFGMKLLPPHIVKSEMDFSIEGNNIRFGLLSIKGISDKSIEKLSNFKNAYSNKFEIFQGAKESGLGIGILCALIQAGALEGFKVSRSKIVYEAQLWNLLKDREKIYAMKLGESLHYDLVNVVVKLSSFQDDKGKPVIKESRMNTIKKHSKAYKAIYSQNKKSESFANWWYEKSLLGYTHNRSLIDIFSEKRADLRTIRQISELPERVSVIFVCYVNDKPYKGKSRKGSDYLRLEVGDETGITKVMVFNEKLNKCKNDNNGVYPQKDSIIVVKGTTVDDAVFADIIAVQNNKVFTKLSDLKDGVEIEEIV
jgi:DNA polymerase-3 subunit alpha